MAPRDFGKEVTFGGGDFSRRLEQAGAKSGDVQISLMWNNVNDLDLHCVDPQDEVIYYGHRRSASGGELDIDMNAIRQSLTAHPVENIYWPASRSPSGTYKVYVNHFANRGAPDPTPFAVRILVRGKTMQFTGAIRYGERLKFVHKFTLESNP